MKEFELVVKFLTRLEELNVPPNWTNDINWYELLYILKSFQQMVPDQYRTFMNHVVYQLSLAASLYDVVPSITRLLDQGAEFAKFSIGFAKFSIGQPHRRTPWPIWMTKYTSSVEFVDGNLNPFRAFPSADLVL